MATEQELAQALGPAFGIYPKAFRGNTGNPQDAANLPVDVMRGRTAGLLGLPSDLLNMFQSPKPMEVFGDVQYEPKIKVPYDTEHFLKTLPLAPTSRAGQVAGQAASFVPLNPAPAVRAAKAGVQALGPTASNMAEDFLMRRGLMPTLDVYHGTPHTLPPTERNPLGEFDASKIGTGEGAQAYGFGIYTAENPAVAQGYKDTLAYKAFDLSPEAEKLGFKLNAGARGEFIRQAAVNKTPEAKAKSLQYANIAARDVPQEKLAELFRAYENRGGGNLYKVDLPDAMIPKMLDYDKPLSKQDPYVRDIIAKAFPSGYINGKFVDPLNSPVTGRAMLDQLNMIANQRNEPGFRSAETALRQAGIPGIKYLDEKSRGNFVIQNTYKDKPYGDPVSFMTEQQAKNYAKEQVEKGFGVQEIPGTRNFVTFPGEEKNLTILERNAEKSAK